MPADDDFRPRRSVLYVPASNARAMQKASALPCDAVILDLEDSVAPEAKAAAREAAVAAVRQGFGARDVIVRCNGLDTPWGVDDLAAAAQAAPDGVLVPKVRGPGDTLDYHRALAPAPLRTRLWVMIETAQAVLNLPRIASLAGETRLGGLVLGPNDLSAELRLRTAPDRAPLQPIMSQMAVAARAHGLAALDGVFNALEDDAGFEAECRQAAAFGFDGKTLIHPRQIDPCNRIFSPSTDEIGWAEAVVAAFAAPEAEGQGAIQLQGKMIERLHLAAAQRLLRLGRP